MLINFSFKNFKTFKDKCSLSFISSRENIHQEHLIQKYNRNRILKNKIIFGFNSSGKSNFVDAIEFSTRCITSSIEPSLENVKNIYRGDKTYRDNISIFNYVFVYDKHKYTYTFGINMFKNLFAFEKLFLESKPVFSREIKEDGSYEINSSFKISSKENRSKYSLIVEDFENGIEFQSYETSKLSFLKRIAKTNFNESKDFDSFVIVYKQINSIYTITPRQTFTKFDMLTEKENKTKMINILNELGFDNLNIDYIDVDFDLIIGQMNEHDKNNLLTEIDKLKMSKNMSVLRMFNANNCYEISINENNNVVCKEFVVTHGNSEQFDFIEESDGFRRLFDIIPIKFIAENEKDLIFVIDELDRSFHTSVTRKILEVFGDIRNSQFIITTQDINLMTTSLLRKDEIVFISRNGNESSLVELQDLKVRSEINIMSEYLKGKFGTLPKPLIFNK